MSDSSYPEAVREFASRTVAYVQDSLGIELEFDSDTLPVLDHYLRSVADEDASMIALVAVTSGAYFGEVIRRRLGGRWDLAAGDPEGWRLVLPTGLSFSPTGIVAEAIAQSDGTEISGEFDMPPKLRAYVESALERMGEVTWETYYSLCGRLDTLEHLQAVLLATAAKLAAEQAEQAEN